jgi:hypothetical protein
MAAQATSLDRIREYLARLTPQARSNLLADIERMQLYGENISGAALILAELRAEFRKGGESNDRLGNPSRYFFKPLEALFVDRPPELATTGQISRGSLSPIWEWINHSLLPAMARDYNESMKKALIADQLQQASQIAAGFQAKVVKSLEGALASEEGVKSAQSGLGQYTSSRGSLLDLKKILSALRIRDAIAAFSNALPPKIEHFEGETLTRVQALLEAFIAKHPQALPFALVIVMKRLKQPWQLAQLAIQASYSRAADHIAATRYAPAVSMVLDHLDERHGILKQALKSNRVETAKEILTEIYNIEYQLHEGIARLDKSDWGKRLDDFMAALAVELNGEYRTVTADIHGNDIHHVLEGIERRRPGAGLLHHLLSKGRDALAGSATYYEKLVGSDHHKAS